MSKERQREFRGTDRFYLERRLGAGGMGVVYRAHDRERDEVVALKLLNKLSPAELYRFKHEFRALADVVHPNLVVLYELLTEGDHFFFTMELVTGVDFLEHVREGATAPAKDGSAPLDVTSAEISKGGGAGVTRTASPDDPTVTSGTPLPSDSVEEIRIRVRRPAGEAANLERLRAASKQLVAALARIHQTGHLHRDIKPSNILVTPGGRVVVLDYGVISDITNVRGRHAPTEIAGTPAYQAPEIYEKGGVIGPASDWYSFGVVLYEALVGWRPYAQYGNKETQRAAKHVEPPLAPIDLRPGLPVELSQLCLDLLQQDPEARPGGEEILHRLGIESQAKAVSVETEIVSTVAGRKAQLQALHDALSQVREGRARTVFLRGLSGMGKSTIAASFLDGLEDVLVFEGRCYERESLPYKALDSVVDALCGYLLQQEDEVVAALLPGDVAALARVFPVLRRVGPIGAAAKGGKRGAGASELRRRAFSALRELLSVLGEAQPLVLYVDDLQWGDAESALLFFELMRPPTPRLLLLGAYRSEEAKSSALLRRLLSKEDRHEPFYERLAEIDVDKLPPAVARELARQLLVESGGAEALVERIAKESAGSPYFIRELVHYVTTHQEVAFEGMTLEKVLLERYNALSFAAQTLLQVVTVAGWRILQSVAIEAAGVDAEGQRAMAELRAAHFVRTEGIGERGRIEAYHDRVREALTSSLDAATQRHWHGRIARALEKSSEVARAEHVYALANHMYHGRLEGEAERIFEINLRAGRQARASHAYEQAYTFLAQAADIAQREDIFLDPEFEQLFGQVAMSAGRMDTAAQYLRRALAHSDDRQQRASLHAALARILAGRMDLSAARTEMHKALGALGLPPVRASVGDTLGALRAFLRGRGADKRPEVFGSADQDEAELLRLEVGLYKYSTMIELYALKPLNMLKCVVRTYEPSVRLGLSPEYVELFVTAAAVCSVKRLRWAESFEKRGQELAEELNDPVTTARTKLYLAIAAHGLGKTQLAVERAEDCLNNHGTWLENVDFLTGVADLCWNLNMRGHAARSWYWLTQGLRRATLTESDSEMADGHSYRSYAGPALAMLDRFDEAIEILDSFRAGLREPAEDEWRWGQYLAHLTLALVIEGDLGERFEEAVAARQEMKLAMRRLPLQLKQFFVGQAYGRLEQYRRAEAGQAQAARKAARRAIKELRRAGEQETLRAHLAAIEAGFFAHEGDELRAEQALAHGEALAQQTDNAWVLAECALIRARMARGHDDAQEAEERARAAWRFAHDTGWRVRAEAIAQEFGLEAP